MEKIENALEQYTNKNLKVAKEHVIKGASFIIKSSQFCRARVISPDTNGEIRLRLIDHGAEAITTNLSELFYVPDVKLVIDAPPLSFYLDLAHLQGSFFQRESGTLAVSKELLGKKVRAQIVDRTGRRPQVDLFDESKSGESVNKRIKHGLLSELHPTLQVGIEKRANLRFIDWDSNNNEIIIYIQVCGFGLDVLSSIETALAELFENGSVGCKELSTDLEYAAPYQGAFYRCYLVSDRPDSNNNVQVFFFDYGNFDFISVKELRKLPETYSTKALPMQAVRTRFHGLPPQPNLQWQPNAQETIYALFGGDVTYRVIPRRVDDQVADVEFLYNDSGKNLNEALAKMCGLFQPTIIALPVDENKQPDSQQLEKQALPKPPESITNNGCAVFATCLPEFNIVKSLNLQDKPLSVNACMINSNLPDSVLCQLFPNDEYNEMVGELNNCYGDASRRVSPPSPLNVGDVAVALTNSGCYLRCQIIEARKWSYLVNFVDYGTGGEIVSAGNVFLLEDRFAKIPPMGFTVKVDGLPAGKLPHSAQQFVQQMSDECLQIKVVPNPSSQFSSLPELTSIISVSGRILFTNQDQIMDLVKFVSSLY